MLRTAGSGLADTHSSTVQYWRGVCDGNVLLASARPEDGRLGTAGLHRVSPGSFAPGCDVLTTGRMTS